MKTKITMQQIADKLNLSKNSVSQALSGKEGVSKETRKQIDEMAQQLGYIYSPTRMHKKQGRTGSIMLIASDFAFHKSFFGEIYLAIEKEAFQSGMNLLIQSVSHEATEKLILPHSVQNHLVDGIMILSHISTEYTNAIISTGIPTILVDHHQPNIFADSILINNHFGAYRAVQHLIDLGHCDIGFIGDISLSPSYYERMEGYLMALNHNNIKANADFIIKNAEEQADFIAKLFNQIERMPTAWFCVNDGLGFLVNSSLQQLGYKVPDQVSIISFDNGQLSQIATPRISTIHIDLKLYGRKAVGQLLWRMENKSDPIMEILLPTQLIRRESTALKQSKAEPLARF
jgi:LacI family transcriptional regulator